MNANTAPVIDSRNVRLGIAPQNAILEFGIDQGTGFEASAILLLGTQTIATWVSSELIGTSDTVPLVSPGQYQLQVTSKFTSNQSTTISMNFDIKDNNGSIISRSRSFTGQRNGAARAIADVFVP
jgi:hypothetical protein